MSKSDHGCDANDSALPAFCVFDETPPITGEMVREALTEPDWLPPFVMQES